MSWTTCKKCDAMFSDARSSVCIHCGKDNGKPLTVFERVGKWGNSITSGLDWVEALIGVYKIGFWILAICVVAILWWKQ